MWTTIEAAGHPRDMGLAQGAASRRAIRAELEHLGISTRRSRWPALRALSTGPVRSTQAGRSVFRHFAHQAERLEGLAKDADVPLDSLLDLHLRVREGGERGGLLARRASLRARTVGGGDGQKSALLERSLPHAIHGEGAWLVRHSRPVVGFASVEITLPWLVSSVAGVNEGGLAVMAGPLLWGASGYDGEAPSHLLVQECLQRFEDLDGALDWCLKRPVEGNQTFVLADASGAVATLISNGRRRRIQTGEGELHLDSGEPSVESAAGTQETAARETSAAQRGAPAQAHAHTRDRQDALPDRVLLDPRARRMQVDAASMAIDVGLLD